MNARTLFFAWGDGSFSCRFFLHGWRYVNAAAQERLAALEPDESLYVTLELTNPRDGVAVQIQTEDSHMIGWAPRYRVRDLATAMAEAPSRYTARVVGMKPAGSGIGVSRPLDPARPTVNTVVVNRFVDRDAAIDATARRGVSRGPRDTEQSHKMYTVHYNM